jgi:hypothetical protein
MRSIEENLIMKDIVSIYQIVSGSVNIVELESDSD